MTWQKVSNYCIKQGEYFISKTGINESTRFTLWHGNNLAKVCKSSEEAKTEYDNLTGEAK